MRAVFSKKLARFTKEIINEISIIIRYGIINDLTMMSNINQTLQQPSQTYRNQYWLLSDLFFCHYCGNFDDCCCISWQIFIFYLVWSFLPCRWSFWFIISCQDSLSYHIHSGPLQAVWHLSLKRNDENVLLLVPPNFSYSGKKVLEYGKMFFSLSQIQDTNSNSININQILIDNTLSSLGAWVDVLSILFLITTVRKNIHLQFWVLFLVLLKTKVMNNCIPIASG